jgi:hypothetical protein
MTDSGNRLEEHGAFNMLIFAIMITPLNLVMLIMYNWHRFAAKGSNGSNKRFITQLVAFTVFSVVALCILTARDREWAKHGLFGVRIDDGATTFAEQGEGLCEWTPSTAWMQLLPFRQNFFVGPLTCPKDNSFHAQFKGDKLVISNCHTATTPVKSYVDDSLLQTLDGAGYSILPATREWGLPLKADSLKASVNDFQMHVIDYLHNHTYAYTEPVVIDATVDTVIARCGTAEPKLVYRMTPVEPKNVAPKGPGGLNVVTLFIDSVSRPMLHRRLPKTLSALRLVSHSPEQLLANTSTSLARSTLFEFFRFHTVGINTGPNTRALWAGLDDDDLLNPLSTGPPLWEQFRDLGYATGRADSMCQDWDSYYNTPHVHNETIATPKIDHEFISYSCLPPYLPPSKKLAGNFKGPTSIVPRCLSGEHQSTHALEWTQKFIEHYKPNEDQQGRNYYVNAGFMDSHEGSGEMLRAIDDRLSAFIHPATSPIDYSNTALVVLSDHGALMGLNYVFFTNGKVERAEPFAAMVLPDEWLNEGGGERMQRMADARMKLMTAFDLYETTRGFAGDGAAEMPGRKGERRGVDFANEELKVRACEEAGIPKADCMCR